MLDLFSNFFWLTYFFNLNFWRKLARRNQTCFENSRKNVNLNFIFFQNIFFTNICSKIVNIWCYKYLSIRFFFLSLSVKTKEKLKAFTSIKIIQLRKRFNLPGPIYYLLAQLIAYFNAQILCSLIIQKFPRLCHFKLQHEQSKWKHRLLVKLISKHSIRLIISVHICVRQLACW